MFDLVESEGFYARTKRADAQRGLGLKRGFDILVAGALLPPLMLFALALALLNPLLNPGPVFFRQARMGQNCHPFVALKFRTMHGVDRGDRGAFDALEAGRVSRLGHLLRRLRIDELPQVINVLRGEMSMIGPRPDALAHAQAYLRSVPDYALRYRLRPGISGYAQIAVGYVDTREAVLRKVAADLHYLAHRSFRFDLWIAWRTLVVILRREGR